jgi:hypothetical protein
MLRRKSKTQFVKQERNTQNATALLNNLKCIVPQQTQVFTTKILKRNFSNKILNSKVDSNLRKRWT